MGKELKTELQVMHVTKHQPAMNMNWLLYFGPFGTHYVQDSILFFFFQSEAAAENSSYLTEKQCELGPNIYLPGLWSSCLQKYIDYLHWIII